MSNFSNRGRYETGRVAGRHFVELSSRSMSRGETWRYDSKCHGDNKTGASDTQVLGSVCAPWPRETRQKARANLAVPCNRRRLVLVLSQRLFKTFPCLSDRPPRATRSTAPGEQDRYRGRFGAPELDLIPKSNVRIPRSR